MRIVETENLQEELRALPPEAHLWIYNGFDVLLPQEIRDEIHKRMKPEHEVIYNFERNLQGPAFSMMQHGVRVDLNALNKLISDAEQKLEDLENYARSLFLAVWDRGVNISSPEQLKQLLYNDPEGFNLPPKYKSTPQGRTITTERKALEDLAIENYYVRPVIQVICAIRDLTKELEFLKRGVESDGRIRCSFNVAATESGRWSSSKNPWGRGANFQNQPEYVRGIYVADEDEILGYPDLSQAESRGVAYYSGDPDYIRATESGDIHTAVARMVWPELEWTGDLKQDKIIAELPFYRHFTRRDMSKRGGHGTNYFGKPWQIARELRVETRIVEEFQWNYFNAFPGIKSWHKEIQRMLQDSGVLITALGRERTFFNRLDSDDTLKEAIAWYPQSTISDILKIGLLLIWRKYELEERSIRLFADMHDGALIGIKTQGLDQTIPGIKSTMTIPVQMPGGVMTIPVDFKVGYRWTKDDMVNWEPGVLEKLTRPTVASDLLDLDALSV